MTNPHRCNEPYEIEARKIAKQKRREFSDWILATLKKK